MCRLRFVLTIILLAVPTVSSASSYVVPTTTLAAQTSNNTSAAQSFSSQSNGNRGAGNISKVSVHSLLYPGATTKVYAHLMLWFGKSNHMNVGYSSADPAQVKRQINDMISRGINGVIIDWYGPNNFIDQATQVVMAEAEHHPGFTFAIMVDQGAIKSNSCTGCSPQQALINHLQYVEQKYFPSPAYMTQQGQPVVTNFDIDRVYSIDWNAVNAALSTHPAFLFQHNSGFSHTVSKGSYSWVMPTTTDYGISYLTSFYNTGMTFPTEETVGATYKGFNDTLASWGSHRIMKQQCGQTWLKTFSRINSLYSAAKQLPYLQLVAWNDYEEGTEIESGIDNCVSLSASVSGNALQWAITGSENTIDHYVAYISTDGQNLMRLTTALPGIRSINLCSFPIPHGSYRFFVQAMGKAGLANQITGSISYSPSCPGSPSNLTLSAAPSALTLGLGQSGGLLVTARPQSGSFSDSVALSCAGLPSGLSCSFSPATITPGSSTASSRLTISAVSVTGMNSHQRGWNLIYATAIWPFSGLALIGNLQRRRIWPALRAVQRMVTFGTTIAVCLLAVSCGGGAAFHQNGTAAKSYSISIDGNAASAQVSTTVVVNLSR